MIDAIFWYRCLGLAAGRLSPHSIPVDGRGSDLGPEAGKCRKAKSLVSGAVGERRAQLHRVRADR